MFARTRISRKAAVVTAAAAAAVSLAVALTGCAGGGGASSSTTLTIAINGEPQSLDPAKNGGDFQQLVQWLSYEPLIRQQADGTFSPGLPVVTKSGGFGAPDALIEVAGRLRHASYTAPDASAASRPQKEHA